MRLEPLYLNKEAGILSAVKAVPGAIRSLPKLIAGTGKAPGEIAKGAPGFGRRVLYRWTGYVPEGVEKSQYLKDVGLLKSPKTEAELAEAYKETRRGRVLGKLSPKFQERVAKRYAAGTTKRQAAEREMIEKGYGSIPGTVKGLVTRPDQIMSLGWKSTSKPMKAVVGGFTGLEGYEAAKAPPEERGKAIGRAIGDLALAFPTMGLGIGSGMAAWEAGSRGAELLGGKVQRMMSPTIQGPKLKPLSPGIYAANTPKSLA